MDVVMPNMTIPFIPVLFRRKKKNKEGYSSKPKMSFAEQIEIQREITDLLNKAGKIEEKFMNNPDFIELKVIYQKAQFLQSRLDYFKNNS